MKNLIGKPYNQEICNQYDWSGLYPVVDSEGIIREIVHADATPEWTVIVNDMFLTKPEDAERLARELLGQEMDRNTVEQVEALGKDEE